MLTRPSSSFLEPKQKKTSPDPRACFTFSFPLSLLLQVDEMKKILIKKLGPPSLTGFNVSSILMYERGVQPGLPLEVRDNHPLYFPSAQCGLSPLRTLFS